MISPVHEQPTHSVAHIWPHRQKFSKKTPTYSIFVKSITLLLILVFMALCSSAHARPAHGYSYTDTESPPIPHPPFKVANWDSKREPLQNVYRIKDGQKYYVYYIVHKLDGVPRLLLVLPHSVGKNKVKVIALNSLLKYSRNQIDNGKILTVPKKGFFLAYERTVTKEPRRGTKTFFTPKENISLRNGGMLRVGSYYPYIRKTTDDSRQILDSDGRKVTLSVAKHRGAYIDFPWDVANDVFDNSILFTEHPVAWFVYNTGIYIGYYFLYIVGALAVFWLLSYSMRKYLNALGEHSRAEGLSIAIGLIVCVLVSFIFFLNPTNGEFREYLYRTFTIASAIQSFQEAGYHSLPLFDINLGNSYGAPLATRFFAKLTHPLYLLGLILIIPAILSFIGPTLRFFHYLFAPDETSRAVKAHVSEKALLTSYDELEKGLTSKATIKTPEWKLKNKNLKAKELAALYEQHERLQDKAMQHERQKAKLSKVRKEELRRSQEEEERHERMRIDLERKKAELKRKISEARNNE